MKPEHAEFIPTLEALMKDLKQHITEEENDDLPALESALQQQESESMAKSFEK